MAGFNPNIPEQQAPNYFGYSQAISPYTFNSLGERAKGLQYSGAANALENVSKGATNTIESIIDNATRTGVDKIREGFTGSLEQMNNVPQDQRVADIQPTVSGEEAGAPTTNLIPGATAAPVPAELQRGIDNAATIAGAGMNKNIPASYYAGRLDMLAKDLRSQFPGHVDYVDQRIAALTGGNPANQYIRDMLSILQTNNSQAKSEREKMISFVAGKSGLPDSDLAIQKVTSGQWGWNDIVHWSSGYESIIAKAAKDKATLESLNADKGKQAIAANSSFENLSNNYITHSAVTFQNGSIPFEQLGDKIQQIQSGTLAGSPGQQGYIPEADAKTLSTALTGYKAQLYNGLYKIAVENGSVEALGSEKVNTLIKNKLSMSIDPIINAINDKDGGAAVRVANLIKGMGDDTAQSYLTSTNTDLRTYTNAQNGLKQFGPNAGNVLFYSYGSKLPGALQTAVENQQMKVVQGTVPLADAIDQLKNGGVGDTSISPAKQSENAAYEKLAVGTSRVIANPNASSNLKLGALNGIFGPGNENLIGKFADDTFTSKGELIPGKHSLLSRMAAPDVTNNIWKLNNERPGVWDSYKVWFDTNSRPVIGSDVHDLNRIGANPNVQLSLDPQTNLVKIEYAPHVSGMADLMNNISTEDRVNIQRRVSSINSVLTSMAAIAKREGSDPTQFIMTRLQGLGLDPSVLHQDAQSIGKRSEGDEPTLEMSARSKEAQIPTDSNVAHVGDEWGNPFASDFQDKHLTKVDTPNGKSFLANTKSAAAFKGFLNDLAETGYKINDVQGFNLRTNKSNPRMLSQHAFGNAIDINPEANPYSHSKFQTDMPKDVAQMAAKWGLVWGGNWTSVKDPMHFEYTGNTPDQSQQGYELAQK